MYLTKQRFKELNQTTSPHLRERFAKAYQLVALEESEALKGNVHPALSAHLDKEMKELLAIVTRPLRTAG